MMASQIEARTRSGPTSSSALRPVVPSGAAERSSCGTLSPRATRAQDGPLTAWARTLVRRPAPCRSKRGYRCVETARLRTTSPRNASRSYDSALCSTHDACVKACLRRSPGSSPSSSSRDSAFNPRGMRGDEVGGLARRQDLGRFLVRNADAVAVLELHHELNEVKRVRLEILLEARLLPDADGLHLQLGGKVIANAL